MTELTFLIELLLNHDLPKATKDLIASRIKEVEQKIQYREGPVSLTPPQRVNVPAGPYQASSTVALMAKHGDAIPVPMPVVTVPEPVEVIAQTPATVAALEHRQEIINAAMSGKADASGKKRKW